MDRAAFRFRRASKEDLPEMLTLMTEVIDGMTVSDWFVPPDADVLKACVESDGFTILAEAQTASPESSVPSKKLAGFFTIYFPGNGPDHLGQYLDFTKEQLLQGVHMDTAVVSPVFRGHKLQARMLDEAEKILTAMPYRYLLVTVHPGNRYSLQNMLSRGYEIQDTRTMYGGVLRHILMKEI